MANNYAALAISRFENLDGPGGYNCSSDTESSRVKAMRILKGFNPNIKTLTYQQGMEDDTCACCNQKLLDHKEWWWLDDLGLL